MLRKVFSCALLFAAGAAGQHALSTTFGPVGSYTGEKVAVGTDFDGDGVPDLLVTSANIGTGVIQVVSGATNSVRQLANPGTSSFAYGVMMGVPDLDLDGRGDIVVDTNGDLRAFSGATLVQRWVTQGTSYALAAPIGDRNGDGREDIAAVTNANPGALQVLSGLDGSTIASYPLPNGGGVALRNLGDVTGNGVPELVRLQSGGVQILRLTNSPVLLTIPYGGASLDVADIAGDSRNEVLIGNSNDQQVRAYDAITGSLIRTWNQVFQGVFAVIGDLDFDGVPELALRTGAYDIRFVSGAQDVELARWPASAQFRPEHWAGGVDFDGDGYGDLVVGSLQASATGVAFPYTGGWQRLSGKVLASMMTQPVACAQGPFFPQLGMTRPVLGTTCTIAGLNAPANTVCFVAFSTQPPVATNLGFAGCDAWFDLGNGVLLATPTGTDWQFQIPLPAAPQLAGFAVALQAFYAPTANVLGLDLTNGIWARLGW